MTFSRLLDTIAPEPVRYGHHTAALAVGGARCRGSGANFLKCMFLSGKSLCRFLCGQDRGPNCRSAGYFSGEGFEVELLFFDFRRQLNAADRHGRGLESLEAGHRPNPLFYSPMVLLD